MCFIDDEISKKHEPVRTFNESSAIDDFHGAWIHLRRVRVRVCVRCSCMQNTGKEALH